MVAFMTLILLCFVECRLTLPQVLTEFCLSLQFQFKSEIQDNAGKVTTPGLRRPQSLYKNPATAVMPAGTGKTETMLTS